MTAVRDNDPPSLMPWLTSQGLTTPHQRAGKTASEVHPIRRRTNFPRCPALIRSALQSEQNQIAR